MGTEMVRALLPRAIRSGLTETKPTVTRTPGRWWKSKRLEGRRALWCPGAAIGRAPFFWGVQQRPHAHKEEADRETHGEAQRAGE